MRHTPLVLLAVIGMLPASLLPVMVSAARGALHFSIAQAASLGAVAIFWAAVGALAIALVGVPARWKWIAAAGLVGLCLLDLASMPVRDFALLLALRGAHGFVGGMLTGIGYAAIGRAAAPDRLFGVLLALQFLVGGVAIALLPSLIAANGIWLLFAVLAGAALLVLCIVPFMPNVGIAPARSTTRGRLPRGRLLWGLAALLLIEAGHTAGGAFMLELGRAHGIALPLVQAIIGLSAMAGVIGAVGAAALGARFGRLGPVLGATAAGIVSCALVLLPSPLALAAGAVIGSVAWAWSIPYVLGGCAVIAPEQGGAVWLSFVAKLGLAAGPLLGAAVVAGQRFEPAILLSCALAIAGAVLFVRLERATVGELSGARSSI